LVSLGFVGNWGIPGHPQWTNGQLFGGFSPYPSEKSWSSSVAMMNFPIYKNHVPKHQPDNYHFPKK
jgi:hypothetical protein